MPSTTINFTKKAKVLRDYPNVHYSADTNELITPSKIVLFSNASVPNELKFKKLTTCALTAYYTNSYPSSYDDIVYNPFGQSFDIDTITYNTWRQTKSWSIFDLNVHIPYGFTSGTLTSNTMSYSPEQATMFALKYGLYIVPPAYSERITVDTTSIDLSVTYVDEIVDQIFKDVSPTSGYVPKTLSNRFSWNLSAADFQYCYEGITQASGTFYYKDGDNAWQNVSCGTNQYCDIPANTFTSNDVQWYVVATTNAGVTLTSDTYTLTTEESLSSAVATHPKDTIVDISIDNVFTWEHVIDTGTLPTKSELQISTDGTTYTALATVNSSDTFVNISANTLSAGTKYWRVRTYNTDNVAGTYSDAVSFIGVGAPPTPVVSLDITKGSARPIVKWQATGQVGYQIKVDDEYISNVYYGTVYSFLLPYYLTDGQHTIYVRVQNNQAMWSDWGSVSLTVTHTEGSAIALTVNNGEELNLTWLTDGNYDSFIVYRDNIPIAKITGTNYTDVFACGSYTYYVKGIYSANNNYGNSNTVNATTVIESAKISLVDYVSWLKMPLADISKREIAISESINNVTKYFAGCDYPFVEIGNQKSKTLTIDVAFKDSAEESILKSMFGKKVCLKTSQNERVIGMLVSLQKNANEFYSTYRFAISNVYFDEEIDI